MPGTTSHGAANVMPHAMLSGFSLLGKIAVYDEYEYDQCDGFLNADRHRVLSM